jgi:ribonuclease Z
MKKAALFIAAGFIACITLVAIIASAPGDEISPTKSRDRGVYFPNSEDLQPDEMRLIALGTGMPSARLSQAATSFLVELGNGDKFLFDIGSGSAGNLGSLEIPYDFLNKVFISHLHTDHMGDLIELYVGGVVAGRIGPLKVWGPTGSEPRLGTKYSMEHMKKHAEWDLEGRIGRLPASAFELEVNEFDFKGENHIIFEENGVTIRAWPAIHSLDGSVSYSLEWQGLKLVFGGDTYPNRWMSEYAKDADVVIHECMMAPEDWITKYGFPVGRALEVATQIHTAPEAFGKVMSDLTPRMAIAFHFFNDFDTYNGVYEGIRSTYDGPLSLATDLMVWNVTKENIKVRMCNPIEDAWPQPSPLPMPPMDQTGMKNVSPEIQSQTFDVIKENQMIYDRINKKFNTNIEMRVKK